MLGQEAGRSASKPVSIRTRPFGRVMQYVFRFVGLDQEVSIRTRPFGRVMPRLHSPAR